MDWRVFAWTCPEEAKLPVYRIGIYRNYTSMNESPATKFACIEGSNSIGCFLVNTFQSTMMYKVVFVSELLRPRGPEALVSCRENCKSPTSGLSVGLFSSRSLLRKTPLSGLPMKEWARLHELHWDNWFTKALGTCIFFIWNWSWFMLTHMTFVSYYPCHAGGFYCTLGVLQVAQKTRGREFIDGSLNPADPLGGRATRENGLLYPSVKWRL